MAPVRCSRSPGPNGGSKGALSLGSQSGPVMRTDITLPEHTHPSVGRRVPPEDMMCVLIGS